MNLYNIIFFHIFKRYYNNGKYKNDIPWLTATGIISVSTFFLLSSMITLIYYFFNNKISLIINAEFSYYGLLFTLINCLWFASNKRYLKIYKDLKISKVNNRKLEILTWIYVFLGIASIPIVALMVRS